MVGEGEGDDQLWGSGRGAIALQGAIVVCYGGGRGGWRPTLGEWTWCHCWVPLQGANFCFISSSYIQGHQFHADAQENNNEFCLELLADATLFSTLITQKLVFVIWGLCWYNFLDVETCGYPSLIFSRLNQVAQRGTRWSFLSPLNIQLSGPQDGGEVGVWRWHPFGSFLLLWHGGRFLQISFCIYLFIAMIMLIRFGIVMGSSSSSSSSGIRWQSRPRVDDEFVVPVCVWFSIQMLNKQQLCIRLKWGRKGRSQLRLLQLWLKNDHPGFHEQIRNFSAQEFGNNLRLFSFESQKKPKKPSLNVIKENGRQRSCIVWQELDTTLKGGNVDNLLSIPELWQLLEEGSCFGNWSKDYIYIHVTYPNLREPPPGIYKS